MQDFASHRDTHPNCSTCDVPMWLVWIERTKAGTNKHFECKACDAAKVTAAAKDDLFTAAFERHAPESVSQKRSAPPKGTGLILGVDLT